MNAAKTVGDHSNIVVTRSTAQRVEDDWESRPHWGPNRGRKPLTRADLRAIPHEISGPVLDTADRCRVWAYLLVDGIGVEVRNEPYAAYHKPV